jgi:two-component system response regulator RegX3
MLTTLQENNTPNRSRHYDCLIVDDEDALSQATCEYFEMFGVSTFWVQDVDACMRFYEEYSADLILLDINLADISGFELCRRLREITNVPILFISARQSDDDRLLALSIGGDDYIQKPYSLSVLLAKVKAVLSRYRSSKTQAPSVSIFSVGDLVLDENELAVVQRGQKVDLKPMEFKLLSYLMKNSGRVITKDELFRKVWEESITSENTLNVHIRRLREKLESDPTDPQYIKTVWGVGYLISKNKKDIVP